VCRSKYVEQLRNIGIINSTTRSHFVGYFYNILDNKIFGLGAGFNSINNLPQILRKSNPSGMLCCAVGFIVFNNWKDCGAFMFGTKQFKKKYVKYEGTTKPSKCSALKLHQHSTTSHKT